MHVIVVGGGPAGSIAALRFAEANHDVTLVESSPGRDKPCGGGIPQAYVEAYDIPEDVIDCRVRLLRFHSPSGRVAECPLGGGAYLAMVRRRRLDTLLRERAVAAGARLCVDRAVEARRERGGVFVRLAKGEPNERLTGDLLIGADGINSVVAEILNSGHAQYLVTAQYHLRRPAEMPLSHDEAVDIYYMPELSASAYGWLFPRRDHFDLGVAALPREAARLWQSLDTARGWLPEALHCEPALTRQAWRIPTEPRGRFSASRVMLVGDAAGLVAPLTGEGIAYAMQSGDLAARVVIAHPDDLSAEGLHRYEAEWQNAHRWSWGVMRMLERQFQGSRWRREALVDFFSERYIRQFVVSAYATRQLPHNAPKFYLRTAWTALRCLTRRLLRG